MARALTSPTLSVRSVSKHYGGVVATKDVSLDVLSGELIGLIGPNGAGKSTLLAIVTGAVRPDGGSVEFLGEDVTRTSVDKRAALGLVRTHQRIAVFGTLTVREHVLTGSFVRSRGGALAGLIGGPFTRGSERSAREVTDALLAKAGLSDLGAQLVSTLALGHRRLVQIATALATDPKLLLLDEVAAGLTRSDKERLAALLRRLRGEGLTILMVEHDVPFISELCERVLVLQMGVKIADGPVDEVLASPAVRSAYLGPSRSTLEPSPRP